MDAEFDRLAEIAQEAGCEQYVRDEHSKVQAIMTNDRLNLAVTGRNNVGKSALINRMLSMDVLEESLIPDEDPRPIRISFARTQDDERYRCVNVLHGAWNERGVTIYELHEHDLKNPAEIDSKDFVLFVVSASAPFSNDEVSALRALAVFPRQVVLVGMDFVPEERRTDFIKKVSSINDSLGLPPILILDPSAGQDIGRVIRNLLPDYNDLKEARTLRCKAIFERTVSHVAAELEREAGDESALAEKAERRRQETLRLRRTGYERLMSDSIRAQVKAARTLTEGVELEVRTMFRKFLEAGRTTGCSDSWLDGLKVSVPQKFSALLEDKLEELEHIYSKDLAEINHNAAFMKLEDFGFEDETYTGLKDRSAEFDASVQGGNSKYKALIGAGIAAGALVLAHIPTAAKVLGSAVSLAGGTMFMKKLNDTERVAQFAQKLNAQVPAQSRAITETLREASEKRYEPLISFLKAKMANPEAAGDTLSTPSPRKALLEGLILECNHMKGENTNGELSRS